MIELKKKKITEVTKLFTIAEFCKWRYFAENVCFLHICYKHQIT